MTDAHTDSGTGVAWQQLLSPSPGRRWGMECGEGVEDRHTQLQHSVPGHAEKGEEEGFTSSNGSRTGAGDPTSSGNSK